MRSDRLLIAAVVLLGACRSAPVKPTAPSTPPRLSATKFTAFGDGITEGVVQGCAGAVPDDGRLLPVGFLSAQGRAQPSPTAYPAKLQSLLAERYPSQSITVVNEGKSGEDIQGAVASLPGILTTNMPDVLLLQEGIDTLNHRDGIEDVVDGLRRMIQEARSRSIVVFAATLLPERAGGCQAHDWAADHDDIIEANVTIRRMIGLEGATLVDLYEAFNGRTALLIGEDGLHPSVAGYERIAQEFLTAIRNNLEN